MVSERHSEPSKINFDDAWYYCCIPSTDQHVDITRITNSDSDQKYHWTAIQLPHVIDSTEESNDHRRGNHEQNWWYRKQFEWNADRPVQLVFTSSNEAKTVDYSSRHTFTVWLNEMKIFSGILRLSHTSIDITDQLVRGKESEQNTLLVCCYRSSLALHADLLENEPKQSDSNEKTSPELPSSQNRVLDYLVRFNDADGLFEVDWNSQEKSATEPKDQDVTNEKSTNTRVPASLKRNDILGHLVHSDDADSPKLRLPIAPDIVVSEHDNLTNVDKRMSETFHVPRLAIVILVVGTRGDVQPFIAFGQKLRSAGHRVRLATHEHFRKDVRKHHLEFFPIAADPNDLMSFMVKNGGIFPRLTSIMEGDLKKRRRDIHSILQSTWMACTANDDETSAPFTAEVIIANPPSLGHIHCAQKLQIPLHMMFTMPWSSTSRFPHALAKLDYSKAPREKLNMMSYDALEAFTWSSTRDIVNQFRRDTLDLPPLHVRQAVRMLIDEQVPYTYCWSPSLVPAPDDWPSYIGVAGFFFLQNDNEPYKPSKDLAAFLGLTDEEHHEKKLPPPMYIGFGSITGNDSERLLKVVLEALEQTGYRAVLLGFDKNDGELPNNVLKISDVPHDWLFPHVSVVCHHGGAGTTAAGLRAGRPTVIVPFFGDQFFWGNVVEERGAGPKPLPGKKVTAKELAEAFKIAHGPAMRHAAERIREAISREDGCTTALHLFHSYLPLTRMHSDLEPTFAACYRIDDFDLQVSRPVAQVLVAAGALDESQFTLHSTREWPGIYDSRVHVPASGLLKHTGKAFSHIFLQSPSSMRRAVSSGHLLTGAVTGIGGVVKNVGKGVGLLSVGVLSLYGELTDVLDRVPSSYDRYREVEIHERPCVTDFRSGARAAGHSITYGWKDGVTGFVKKPRIGYRRHGLLGGVGGVLVATANGLVEPAVGSLASVTWLSRGAYADMKKRRRRRRATSTDEKHILLKETSRQSSVSSTDEDDHRDNAVENDKEASRSIKFAAVVSGYPAEVCQYILDEFEKVKERQKKIAAMSPDPTTEHRRKRRLRLHRRDSDSAL